MTDFTISGNSEISKYDSILIHFYYSVLNYDYRNGLFTDESSIYDMGGTGLSDDDYTRVADEYETISATDKDMTYTEGQKLYFKLLNKAFDAHIVEKFKISYGLDFDLDKHLLVDIAKILEQEFPGRRWELENLFILRKFDVEREKVEHERIQREKDTNIIKIPVKKKLTEDEIRNGSNEFLMMNVLGMSYAEAEALAKTNFEKKTAGKRFVPYRPDEDSDLTLS